MSTQLYNGLVFPGQKGLKTPIDAGLDANLVLVTPEEAQKMLTFNSYERQRTIRHTKVTIYADAMEKKRFEPGTQLSFGYTGSGNLQLLDGQHRLQAVVKSGIPQWFVIRTKKYETEQDLALAYGHFDQHAKRSDRDNLKAIGLDTDLGFSVGELRVMSSAVRLINEGKFNRNTRPGGGGAVEDLREWISYYADAGSQYFEAIAGSPQFMRTPLTRAATLGVALVTFKFATRVYGDEKIFEFWRGTAMDDGLSLTDPRKTANRHLLTASMSGGHGASHQKKDKIVTPAYSTRYLANCWNAWAEDRTISSTNVRDMNQDIHILGTPFVRA